MKKKEYRKFKEVVLQSNDITNSKTTEFTKQELNCFLFILSKLKEDVYDYNVSTLDLMKFLSIETKRTSRVIDSMDKLLRNSIHIPQDNGRVLAVTILQHFEYHKEEKVSSDNYISFKVADRIRPYLFNLQEKFTILNIAESLALNKKNSYILYTFLRQWKELKKKKVMLEEFRTLFENKNLSNGHFLAELKKSMSDIEKNTSIKNITIEKIKRGRVITHLVFKFDVLNKKQIQKLAKKDEIAKKYDLLDDKQRNMFNRLNSEFGLNEHNSMWVIEICTKHNRLDKLQKYLYKVYLKYVNKEIDFVTKYVQEGIKTEVLGLNK